MTTKYIDADKLIAELNKIMGEYDMQQVSSENPNYEQGAMDALYNFKLRLSSLQQEQPEAYNRAMLEVKAYVDKLYDNTSIGLNEYDMGLYNGISETCMKLRGFIKARISMEQPEVDLEKDFEKEIDKTVNECTNGYDFDWEKFARHFYDLGRNARKEE